MTGVTRILCPVDFSDHAAHALTCGGGIARWCGARLTALHVHQMGMPLVGFGPYVEQPAPIVLTSAERTELAAALDAFVKCQRQAGTAVDTVVEEAFNVPVAILERAQGIQADLVVLGTHGRSGVDRLMLGSVAERVLRKAACPVLTVPPRTPGRVLDIPASLRHVVCPVDFSPASAAALQKAARWASAAGARLTAIHTVELAPDIPEPPLPEFFAYRDRLIRNARHALAEAVGAAGDCGCPIDQYLVVGRAYHEILAFAEQRQADLIVMGVRGRSALGLTLFGSTTQHVVRAAISPVLTVHPQ